MSQNLPSGVDYSVEISRLGAEVERLRRELAAEIERLRPEAEGSPSLRLLFELQDTGKVKGPHSGLRGAVLELVERAQQAEARLGEVERILKLPTSDSSIVRLIERVFAPAEPEEKL